MSRPSTSTATYRAFQRIRLWKATGTFLNYLGQLRLYSYADLCLLLAAGGAGMVGFTQASMLWFAFLIYLEWRHRDRGRRPWPWVAWAGLGLAGFLLSPGLAVLPFAALCAIYANKKAFERFALISPAINGLLKASLVLIATGGTGSFLAIVAILTGLRNLAGDMRDVTKDRDEHVETIPVRMGFGRDYPILYPAALAVTSAVWTLYGELPVEALVGAWVVELTTYRLTPR